MTPWERDSQFVALFVATGFLAGEDAQSLLLVGAPGEGKSAMISRFAHVPTVKQLGDMTSGGIKRDLASDPESKIRHFAFTEFNRLFARREATAEQTLGVLTGLMTRDSGVERVGMNDYDFTGRQIGIIAAITSDIMQFREQQMTGTGLLSRFTQFYMHRDPVERDRVHRNIIHGIRTDLTPVRYFNGLNPNTDITIGPDAQAALWKWVNERKRKPTERMLTRINALLKACALLMRSPVARAQHVAILRERWEAQLMGPDVVSGFVKGG